MQDIPKQLGPYHIIRKLGRGGMGAVYEGIHIETGEPAAVKVLLETLDEDPEVRFRFEAEIDALKMLRHPHIVRLDGFGEENNRLYYVMELVNGTSLYQELKSKRSFTWQDVAKIGYEVCLALKHGHDRGIIHRDIKPANIMLDNSGSLKLSDYGIAHFFGDNRLTSSNSVIGTIEFMSPEQALAGPVNPKSDLYSLGAVLYTLLCRRPPLLAKTLPEIIKKHKSEQPEGILRSRRDVPNQLVSIIHTLLENRPEDRPATAYVVVKQIEAILVNEFGSTDAVIVLPSNKESSFSFIKDGPETKTALTPEVDKQEQSRDSSGDSAFLLQMEDRLEPTKLMTQNEQRSGESASPELSTDPSQMVSTDSSILKINTNAQERHKPTEPNSSGSVATIESPEIKGERTNVSRFVRVREDERGRYPGDETQNQNPLISVQVAVLSICLVVLGLWAWYMLQPKSADVLYSAIDRHMGTQIQNSGITPSPSSVEDEIKKFLELYPKDPRAPIVQGYRNEIDLAHEERLLERRQMSLNSDWELLPVQRAYLESISVSNVKPEETIEKLEAIIDLYGGGLVDETDLSNPNGVCVELSKRRLKRLHQELDRINELQLEQLTTLLNRADAIEKEDPIRANRMRRGLLRLYDEKPWASELLERARKNVH